MFGKSKDSPAAKDQVAAALPAAANLAPPPPTQAARPAAAPENTSSISAGMKIVGKVVTDGAVKIFGRVEGELQGSSIAIHDGAHIEGDILAQEVIVGGHVKGAITALRVTLQSTAVVEGDISHRSLTIDENARFEGISRRGESTKSAGAHAKTQIPQLPPQPLAGGVEGNGKIAGEEKSNPAALPHEPQGAWGR